jgi:hypothetical protein
MRPSVGVPTLSRRSRILLISGAVLLVVLLVGSRLLDTYVDWLWFGEVGFRSVFSTVLLTRLVLLVLVGVLIGGLLAVSLIIAYRTRPVFVPVAGPEDPVARYRTAVTARLRLIGIGLPVIVGAISGLAGQGDWQTVQLFMHGTAFGTTDPQFHLDVGFYAFDLPFYRMLLDWLFVAVVVAFIGALLAHYVFGGIRLAGRSGTLSGAARIQLAILAGTFVLLKAAAYFLDRYELLFSDRNSQFNGASYTDLNAVLPAKLILLCIAVFCALAFFAGAVVRNLQLPAIAIVLMVLSSVLIGAAWPAVVEQFSVRPNANEKEAQPIGRNIAATRDAYGLGQDKVTYKSYQGTTTASTTQVGADDLTIPNIRLLDPSVLAKTFTQQHQLRNFYGFPQKLDVDRYNVKGQTHDYIVAAREINTDGLAENQRNWINRHLVYTHGNGFVAAPANAVNSPVGTNDASGGYPNYTISDLTAQGDIPVEQPRIYYGELVTDYAIVGGDQGGAREYDTDTKQFSYTGSGGVSVGGLFNRLVFAAHYGERNILFNSAIQPGSKIIYNRDPRDRVQLAAPWLTLDGDPYPAVVGGRIVWIVDGYTTLDNYPYAQRTSLQAATTDTLRGVAGQPNRQISYIRNSVKAVVDAYDGSVKLYGIDEKDPVLKAWEGVFPGTVLPNSAVPPELRQHFRYPEDLFKVQRDLLTRYHVSDPGEFFSTVSFWSVPSDPTTDSPAGVTTPPQPPYYVLAGPPQDATDVDQNTSTSPTFQLTSPLVSLQREFLSAYLSVSSDPGSYGKFTVLSLPSDTQTQGPQQVQSSFVSSPDVIREINTLKLNSTVTYGNLLTLPVAGGLVYVEPVYTERSGQDSSYPQLTRVLVSYAGKVGYASTIGQALDQVFGAGAGAGSTAPGSGQTPSTSSSPPSTAGGAPPTSTTAPAVSGNPALEQAVQDISSALGQIKDAQQKGDFTALGQAYQALDDATKRFNAAKTAAPSTPPATSSAPPPVTQTTAPGGG